MASTSRYHTVYSGAQTGGQTTYTNAIPLRKPVGSGGSTKLPRQHSRSNSSETFDITYSPNATLRPPTNATNVYSGSSISNPPVCSSSQTPSMLSPSKLASGPLDVPVYSHRRDTTLLLMVVLASVCFIVTAWFAQATFSSTTFTRTRDFFKSEFRVDIGDTLTILALLSRLLTVLTAYVLNNILEVLQWSLTCRDHGLSISSALAISGSTGLLGTLGIIVGKSPEKVARIWATTKLALRFSILVAGVVLFLNTSVETVYKSTYSYKAAAGIGPFEGSYINVYRESLRLRNLNRTDDVVPYTTLAVAHGLIVNPMHSISSQHASCDDVECDSYILPGGLVNSSPKPPLNLTDDPVILLDEVPSYRIDFQQDATEDVADGDCDLYFQHPFLIAIRFCVAPSHVQQGSVHVSLQVCDNGTSGNTCLSNSIVSPSLNTTFSLSVLTTSLVVARSNYSILSVSRESAAILDYSLDVASYRTALRWLLNFTASGIPAPTSAVEYFWASPEELTSDYWSIGQRQAFQSVLAYPLWFFNVNNAGNLLWGGNNSDLILPAEFYTTASVASPFTKIVVNKAMFVVFVILQSIILIGAWLTVIALWTTDIRLPNISSYPMVDFASKTEDPPSSQGSTSPVTDLFRPGRAGDAGNTDVLTAIAGRRVRFRDSIEPAESFMPWVRSSISLRRRTTRLR